MTIIVIPCGASKGATAAKARDLYTGAMFKHTLAAAEAIAADVPGSRIVIMSARYGLLDLETVVEPYDQRITDEGAVTAGIVAMQASTFGIDFEGEADVFALLPLTYYRVLDAALRQLDVYAQNVYETAAGIGEQRNINRLAARG